MTAKSFTLVLLLALFAKSYGATIQEEATLPLAGVDPNTLQCDPKGKEFLLLPHFEECNKFYMCAHGEEVEFSCSGGTIFDFELQTCNWSWATKCWLRDSDIESEGSGSGDLEWVVEDEQASAVPADVLLDQNNLTGESNFANVLDCANARDASKLTPFNGDCQRYWRCVDGLPVSAYCTDGLFFNAQSQQCDFESNVRCIVQADDELQGEFMVYQ